MRTSGAWLAALAALALALAGAAALEAALVRVRVTQRGPRGTYPDAGGLAVRVRGAFSALGSADPAEGTFFQVGLTPSGAYCHSRG